MVDRLYKMNKTQVLPMTILIKTLFRRIRAVDGNPGTERTRARPTCKALFALMWMMGCTGMANAAGDESQATPGSLGLRYEPYVIAANTGGGDLAAVTRSGRNRGQGPADRVGNAGQVATPQAQPIVSAADCLASYRLPHHRGVSGPVYRLDQLIAAAFGHPAVTGKRAEADATRAEGKAARQQFFPTTSVQYGSGNKGSTAVVVSQPLWTAGRLTAGLEAARERIRAADYGIAESQYAVALRVVTAYQAWLQSHWRHLAQAKGHAMLEGYAATVKRRMEGGVSAESDLNLVKSRLAQSRGDLAALQAGERSALATLAQLTGLALNAGSLAIPRTDGIPSADLGTLVAQAENNHPTLLRHAAEIEAGVHDVAQKRAAQWPTLNLRAEHQQLPQASGGGHDNRLMLALEYAPGAGLSVVSAAEAAAARVGGLRDSREAARRDLLQSLHADYEDHLAARTRRQELDASRVGTCEVLSSYDRLFSAGRRNWLDVINMAREVTQVELAQADVEAVLIGTQARVRLHAGESITASDRQQ